MVDMNLKYRLNCKFCHKQVPKLVDAHVIPRSLYKATRGKGKSFILIGVDKTNLDRKFKQVGISNKTLLCESCERLFSPYDTHGFKVITDTLASKQIYQDAVGNPVAYLATTANYNLFKLFILSVLWRASVSSLEFFQEIKLGLHEERIRKMLEDNAAGSEGDYPILCFHQTGHKYPSTILPPFQQRTDDGINYCRLYLPPNMIFVVKIDSRPLPESLFHWIIKPNSRILFQLLPYFGSYEMRYIEEAKVLTKKHLGIPARTIYRYEKSKL